jgi:hypothetical protein
MRPSDLDFRAPLGTHFDLMPKKYWSGQDAGRRRWRSPVGLPLYSIMLKDGATFVPQNATLARAA